MVGTFRISSVCQTVHGSALGMFLYIKYILRLVELFHDFQSCGLMHREVFICLSEFMFVFTRPVRAVLQVYLL